MPSVAWGELETVVRQLVPRPVKPFETVHLQQFEHSAEGRRLLELLKTIVTPFKRAGLYAVTDAFLKTCCGNDDPVHQDFRTGEAAHLRNMCEFDDEYAPATRRALRFLVNIGAFEPGAERVRLKSDQTLSEPLIRMCPVGDC